MTWQSSQHGSGRRGRYVPRLEALEERRVPAANLVVSNSTLFILASTTAKAPQNERITIFDNGTSAANNVVVVSGATFFPNLPINDIEIRTGDGNDHVSYNLTGDLTGQRLLDVHLGKGNDQFSAFLRRNLLNNANLNMNVFGEQGNDKLKTTLIGSLASGSHLGINLFGGRGNNTLDVLSTNFVTVQPGANIGINAVGGGAADNMFIQYAGRLDGSLNLFGSGGHGVNNLGADIELSPGSVGSVGPGRLIGGPSSDNMNFIVRYPTTAQANNLLADGGPGGFDTITRTTNVSTLDVDKDTVIA